MNVRDYMHEIHSQNAITLSSNEDGSADGKRKMSKAEARIEQQNKNKDLTMNMYKVLSSRAKGLDETRRAGHARVTGVLEKVLSIAMEREEPFQTYFANSVTREDVKMKIELVDATRYEMRVFLKSFPLPDSFQMNFGLQYNVPHGCAEMAVNQYMGRVEKMIIKSEWGYLMDGDVLSPTKIVPWFTDGLIRAVRSIQMDDNDADQNKIAVELCEKGVELYITDVDQRKDAKDNKEKQPDAQKPPSAKSISNVPTIVTCIASVHGTSLPKGMRLQHALPNREPYSSQGKQVIDEMLSEIGEGRSLFTMDACVDTDDSGQLPLGFWEISFRTMTERVMNNARSFGKTNMIDPAIHVIEMMSISRRWDIPTNIIETAALWEFRKSANKMRNEAMSFRSVLTRLHGFFQTQSCPHFLLANYNLLKLEDKMWCDAIAKEIGDAMAAMDDDPGRLLELTGTNKKKEKRDAAVDEGDAVSMKSQTEKVD
ncbi:hypothetical protein EB796_014977 [Bugula neritina]|uniref:Uncharacterized protein n=1 Tax=Bugula neritina TaxID=10212 RepID=A0A7J7JKP2_BUGNE|nr:hypothetical protein EB796_014977 [Bugula neritina]